MLKIKEFIKNEFVLCAAGLLALCSMLAVPPSPSYLSYLDFHTLILLFCLMAVVAGLQIAGIFHWLAGKLLQYAKNTRQLAQILIFLSFFCSMLITNDVSLITFVPLALYVLTAAGHSDMFIPVVVLQTVAANLGSILLPVGNPQNLYLYGISEMGFAQFVLHMLPLWLLSLVVVVLFTLPLKKAPLEAKIPEGRREPIGRLYILLFLLCIVTVAGFLSEYLLLGIIVAFVAIFDRRVFRQVDYLLLLTFVCFFVFIGNMKAIPSVSQLLSQLIAGNELIVGILSSQIISNVPAAILLSGFTDQTGALLWSTNIGGLGTLIASLASLISYKAYMRQIRQAPPCNTGAPQSAKKYMLWFTLVNVAVLVILTLFAFWWNARG